MRQSYEITRALDGVRAAWLAYLYQRVAKKLSGRVCMVEFVSEPLSGYPARGVALKSGDTGIIRVRDDLEPRERLSTYLHECSHICLHFSGLADISEVSQVLEVREWHTGRAPAPAWLMEQRRAEHDKREVEAKELSGKWLAYAESHAESKSVSDKLVALLDMQDTVRHG